jgi:L-lysine exporter family protein LysE/ArgO
VKVVATLLRGVQHPDRQILALGDDDCLGALLARLFTGLWLIIAIGAQNAYVLRMGLSRHHVSLIVTICAVSDVVLIVLGVGGIGSAICSAPSALQIVR